MIKRWKKVSRKIILKHPRLEVFEDIVELPSGERTDYILYESKLTCVMVLSTRGNKILLQKEYSYPPNKILYQFPGGKVEKNESIISAARRELAEESNLKAKSLKSLGWYYINNRRSKAKMYAFLAENPVDDNSHNSDPEEFISSHWVTVKDFKDLIKNGNIVNSHVLNIWTLYTINKNK